MRLEALAAMCAATLLRLAREGMVLRALVWPGLLAAAALVLSAGGLAMIAREPSVILPSDAPAAMVSAFAEAGFARSEDPDASLRVERDGEAWLLHASRPGSATLRAEAVLRQSVGAGWVPIVPAPEARSADMDLATGWIAGLVALLFALYGVVLGAGTVLRDREEGVLEAELALPVPRWAHGASRAVASVFALGLSLGATLLLLHGLVGIAHVGPWILQGIAASAAGVALGLWAMRGGRSFSGPVSRALSGTLGLVGLGLAVPALGARLPVASLAFMLRGQSASALSALIAGLMLVYAIYAFDKADP